MGLPQTSRIKSVRQVRHLRKMNLHMVRELKSFVMPSAAMKLDLWSGRTPPFEQLTPTQHRGDVSASLRRKYGAKRPTLTPFLLPATPNAPTVRPLVIVAPGGGYVMLSPKEGEPACRWLNSLGFHAGLLLYRTLRRHPAPLLDARRAVQLVRNNSVAWRVNPARVAILGFSAGGHLAGHLAIAWNLAAARRVDAQLQALGDAAAFQSPRVDAAILAYPVASAHNDTVGTIGRDGWTCVAPTYGCTGTAKYGEPRPIRHFGSIEILLGPGLGTSSVPRAGEAEVSLEDLVLSQAEAPPPLFIWATERDQIVPSANAIRLARAVEARRIRDREEEARTRTRTTEEGLSL